ncbi:MAG: DUF366 family protein, partial [Bdellovibrionales bacterium]|nr:DUF366 family protein [Bdellovibrionales bacterium]
ICWQGPCAIPFDKMVDGEDLLEKSKIEGSMMLHFIIEKFHQPLFVGVALQRLFSSLVKDVLVENFGVHTQKLKREGDDIFYENRKLSISIATQSPVSTLIHFAANISNEGTPVKTSSLQDFNISPKEFSDILAKRFIEEINGIEMATMKVKWVR